MLIEVVQQLDASHKGLSRTRKKERLERVLEIPVGTPEQLQQKLASILKGWTEAGSDGAADGVEAPDGGPAEQAGSHFSDDPQVLCELLAQVLDIGMAGLLAYEPHLAQEAEALARIARAARTSAEVASVRGAVKSFLLKVELTTAYELADDEAKAIVSKIEDASGRTVEATRTVDSALIGGLILQAGSLRVDASVRGRLDRLRRDLVTRN